LNYRLFFTIHLVTSIFCFFPSPFPLIPLSFPGSLPLIEFNNFLLFFLIDGDKAAIENLLKNKSKKYDLYFYVVSNSHLIGDDLMDLNGYIPEDLIDLYRSPLFNETCYHNNKLIGFPIDRAITALYVNKELLDRYKFPIPKTWEQLINTTNYVLEEEKKLNSNSDRIGLTAIFGDDDEGTFSMQEMLYSFRKTPESDYPDLKSQEALDALIMLKKVLNLVPEQIKVRKDLTNTFNTTRSVFVKYWGYEYRYPAYKMTLIPGWKEGISVSSLGGTDIGISDHIDKNRKLAAIEVIKFWISREEQKEMIIKRRIFSGIQDLYNDEEVCAAVDCELYGNIQTSVRYNYEYANYAEYSTKFRHFMHEYMYGDKTAEEVLKNIDDLSRIQELTLDIHESEFGLVYLILIISIIVFVLITLPLLNLKRVKPFIKFLPKDFWYIILLGLLLYTLGSFTNYGTVSIIKCRLELFLSSIGFTCMYVPILYKLIVNFPEENKRSQWVSKNRFTFLFAFLICDIVLNFATLFSTSTIETIVSDNKNYQTCSTKGSLAMVFSILGYLDKVVITLLILFLVFVEWSIEETLYDIRFIVVALYFDAITIIPVIIFDIFDIINYGFSTKIHKILILVFIFSNYLFLVGIRIIISYIINVNESGEKRVYASKYVPNNNSNLTDYSEESTGNKSSHSKYNKIIKYHYQKSVGSSSNHSTSVSNNINYFTNSVTSSKQNPVV